MFLMSTGSNFACLPFVAFVQQLPAAVNWIYSMRAGRLNFSEAQTETVSYAKEKLCRAEVSSETAENSLLPLCSSPQATLFFLHYEFINC